MIPINTGSGSGNQNGLPGSMVPKKTASNGGQSVETGSSTVSKITSNMPFKIAQVDPVSRAVTGKTTDQFQQDMLQTKPRKSMLWCGCFGRAATTDAVVNNAFDRASNREEQSSHHSDSILGTMMGTKAGRKNPPLSSEVVLTGVGADSATVQKESVTKEPAAEKNGLMQPERDAALTTTSTTKPQLPKVSFTPRTLAAMSNRIDDGTTLRPQRLRFHGVMNRAHRNVRQKIRRGEIEQLMNDGQAKLANIMKSGIGYKNSGLSDASDTIFAGPVYGDPISTGLDPNKFGPCAVIFEDRGRNGSPKHVPQDEIRHYMVPDQASKESLISTARSLGVAQTEIDKIATYQDLDNLY